MQTKSLFHLALEFSWGGAPHSGWFLLLPEGLQAFLMGTTGGCPVTWRAEVQGAVEHPTRQSRALTTESNLVRNVGGAEVEKPAEEMCKHETVPDL